MSTTVDLGSFLDHSGVADLDDANLAARHSTTATSPFPSRPAVEIVRSYERAHGRRLVDTCLGAWPDLASESQLKALLHWGLPLSDVLTSDAARYISFREGRPQRAVDVHIASSPGAGVWMRQRHLLAAAAYAENYWLYVLVRLSSGALSLLALNHPTRVTWTAPPAHEGPGVALDAADAMWHLSASAVTRLTRLPAAA